LKNRKNENDKHSIDANETPETSSIEPPNRNFEIDLFLHEPIRLRIIAQLFALEQADMIYLKNSLEITWGNLSSHASKLEEKGYITIAKQFIGKKPYTICKITDFGKEQFNRYRQTMQTLLK